MNTGSEPSLGGERRGVNVSDAPGLGSVAEAGRYDRLLASLELLDRETAIIELSRATENVPNSHTKLILKSLSKESLTQLLSCSQANFNLKLICLNALIRSHSPSFQELRDVVRLGVERFRSVEGEAVVRAPAFEIELVSKIRDLLTQDRPSSQNSSGASYDDLINFLFENIEEVSLCSSSITSTLEYLAKNSPELRFRLDAFYENVVENYQSGLELNAIHRQTLQTQLSRIKRRGSEAKNHLYRMKLLILEKPFELEMGGPLTDAILWHKMKNEPQTSGVEYIDEAFSIIQSYATSYLESRGDGSGVENPVSNNITRSLNEIESFVSQNDALFDSDSDRKLVSKTLTLFLELPSECLNITLMFNFAVFLLKRYFTHDFDQQTVVQLQDIISKLHPSVMRRIVTSIQYFANNHSEARVESHQKVGLVLVYLLFSIVHSESAPLLMGDVRDYLRRYNAAGLSQFDSLVSQLLADDISFTKQLRLMDYTDTN